MKVSLGISVLMMNVTFLTETSLRPSRASSRASSCFDLLHSLLDSEDLAG